MASRLELHSTLKSILQNVYYQPPESKKLTYPCIVYGLSDLNQTFADSRVYHRIKGYQMTLIHSDPDNTIVEQLASLPYCRLDRAPYVSDGLYHYPFTIFY